MDGGGVTMMTVCRLPVAALALLLVVCLSTVTAPVAWADPNGPTSGAPTTSTTSAPASTPTSDSGHPSTIVEILPDPRQWAIDVFNQVLIGVFRGIANAIHGVVDSVLGSSLNFISQTPPNGSYANGTVQALWGVVRAIADAALVVIALVGGVNLILREHVGATYHELAELFPRLVLGALLANTSLSWARLAIDANNALCGAVGQFTLPAWSQADPATQALVGVIVVLVYLITSLLLLLQMLMRLALIDVLLVVAPLALLCWVLPQTQGWARLWTSTFFGTVFTQFLQVLALKLGGALLGDPSVLPVDAAVLELFLGVAVLALTMKLPGLLRSHLGDGLGFVRYVAYRQGARALEGASGKGGA
jgi:hypothetical protein